MSKSRNATAMAWAYAAATHLPAGAWKVLMILARRVNNKRDDFEVWPGQELIADETGLSLSTVKRHLNALEADRWLTRAARAAPGRGFVGKSYTLNVVAEFVMPNGAAERRDFYADEGFPRGGPTGQNDLHQQVSGELHRQVTADLLHNEHKKGEHKNPEPPLDPPRGETAVADATGRLTDEAVSERYMACWNRLVETAPQLAAIKAFGGQKQKELRARVRDYAPAGTGEAVDAFLAELFSRIASSKVLCGESDLSWRPAAAWPVMKKNCTKIMEDFYDRDRRVDGAGHVRGYSPNLEAGRAARDALRAMYGEAGDGAHDAR